MNQIIKPFIVTIITLLYVIAGHAQDSIQNFSASMFDHNQAILLFSMETSRFHKGNDPTWAQPDINTSDWKKMSPRDLTHQIADENGRMEGWFRVKIRLDSSFANTPLHLGIINRGYSAEIYLNGKLINTYGTVGIGQDEFKEYVYQGDPQMKTVNLKPNTIYTVAIHFVSYLPPFPLNLIYQFDDRFVPLLSGPALILNMYQFQKKISLYYTVWITVSTVLTLLFWLLAFQNPAEKNLRLFAIYSTCISISVLLMYFNGLGQISYKASLFISVIESLFTHLILVLIPVIVLIVLTNKLPRKLVIALVVFLIITFFNRLLWNFIPLLISVVIIVMGITLYNVFTSWKRISGAQWAVVAGVLATLFFAISWAIMTLFTSPLPLLLNTGQMFMATGIFLSFPMSLLVYVALRFQEILKDVQEKAARVVKVTEEKRQQALNQQVVLEKKVKERTSELSQSLQDLKSTQSQLIHAEKMASLGELTAGIAHEIQNPLNFVNNFSEINGELIEELKTERSKNNGEREEKLEDEIINDIENNTRKINHHGKRAESIVNGMLLHSRGSSGQKEPTDINALCDEYLRLSYHGFRAKDKSFRADFKLETDQSLPKINVVPQDIGRGLLNLINNAFYTVDKKAKENHKDYKPEVVVSTRKSNDTIEIHVRDNGSGIPEEILDKIFQPFFTTKPTGQGTGLGLSLSYDIVKAHRGDITLDSQMGIGTTFQLTIPMKN